jgi:indole-3-glycerol phosphate synthase
MGFLREVVSAVESDLGRPYNGAARTVRAPASLRSAVLSHRAAGALLVEFKRRSPGARDPDLPRRSAEQFVSATASAEPAGYSCVATRHGFGGSPEDVARLAATTDRPILYKEFVVDRAQLDIAREVGASAVLLIARLETEGLLHSSLAELARNAHDRGLEVLLEFHAKSELRRAVGVGADMYGVNVRDLDTLQMEPEVAAETIRSADAWRPLLGLSGVESPAEARRFWDLGVDGILVGSAVARSETPAEFLRSLRRSTSGVG